MMNKKLAVALLIATTLSNAGSIYKAQAAPNPTTPGTGNGAANVAPKAPYKVSGPFKSDNLSVYLIHGADKFKGQNILTVEEALKQKQIIIEETSNVNELRVRNLCGSVVFLQSGDIVKGGKQDRAVQYDLLLPPKAGFTRLPVFCVEHGRWQQRGMEKSEQFALSENQIAGKELKLAAKRRGDQQAVWDGVAACQQKISRTVGGSVCSPASPSSLELTMEHGKVKEATEGHLKNLAKIPDGKNDVIGYAFAVNGKISSADVYASSDLFKKLWPKLLKSSAAEAVAEKDSKPSTSPDVNTVLKFMVEEPKKAAVVNKMQTKESAMSEQEDSNAYRYKTRWYNAPRNVQIMDARPSVSSDSDVIHSNYIAK